MGLSEAKGLAYALDIPMIGISTLQIMVTHVMFDGEDYGDDPIFVPMIDARRMEVYTAAYDMALGEVMTPQPLILNENSYADLFLRVVPSYSSATARIRRASLSAAYGPRLASCRA